MPKQLLYLSLILFFATSCSDSDRSFLNKDSQKGEYIYRNYDDKLFALSPLEKNERDLYPWEKESEERQLITKEYFRCKGCSINPPKIIVKENGEIQRFYDCGGAQKHSLPLRNQKEFIYPILTDLVNYIQTKTERKVVITCGHTCPEHNTYSDPSVANQTSKHMIGAEVAFYVQGLENHPQTIVSLLQDYFKTNSKYKDQKDYIEFKRYEKETNVSIPPWFNKEVFIKLFQKHEGRNFDNRHPFPYISIQVRYDYENKENVMYSWDKATKNYLRR